MSLPSEILDEASNLVRSRAGLAFNDGRRAALSSAISDAMRRASVRDPGSYLDRLAHDQVLLDDLLAEVTVAETYFFRDPDQLSLLRDRVLPNLLSAQSTGQPLRVWSAGCASGEEPFTLAIMLEQLGRLQDVRILGTDISRPALEKARGGRYTEWSLRGVPQSVRQYYFKKVGDRYLLRPEIRDRVAYEYLNLAQERYTSAVGVALEMDLILCRNVLIYFDPETVARVAHRLLAALAPAGCLVIGSADPPLSDLVPCDVEVTAVGLIYRRQSSQTRPRSYTAQSYAPPPTSPPAGLALVAPSPTLAIIAPAPAAAPFDPAGGPERWVDHARSLADRGDLAAARKACADGIDLHGECAELALLHAVLLSQTGGHREAAGAARRALYLDRSCALAHLTLASSLLRLGDADGARKAFRNAARLLDSMAPDALVPGAGAEPAGRLAELAHTQLALLGDPVS
jgi:chemotaxis protein methyltransferase CheR